MPQLEISAELANAVENVMKNEYVKQARVFDTKDGTFNLLNLMILLNIFDEATLIKGLNINPKAPIKHINGDTLDNRKCNIEIVHHINLNPLDCKRNNIEIVNI